MGIIICQSCDKTIAHYEEEKVTTLYAKCNSCSCSSNNQTQHKS
ncbi:GapA-binding peptide SR1P [Bacillus salitolerans]|uniref:GapA-binding peptide SR1P n=1 Tax=Bacillus salitolerans TaxID=1437434 RepID=A0ABW4LLM3_9BACI